MVWGGWSAWEPPDERETVPRSWVSPNTLFPLNHICLLDSQRRPNAAAHTAAQTSCRYAMRPYTHRVCNRHVSVLMMESVALFGDNLKCWKTLGWLHGHFDLRVHRFAICMTPDKMTRPRPPTRIEAACCSTPRMTQSIHAPHPTTQDDTNRFHKDGSFTVKVQLMVGSGSTIEIQLTADTSLGDFAQAAANKLGESEGGVGE
ncbi:unnamed protein product [Vitrella brassicaformis CCMP3155]|uniref:Ubiquitin-like domain-containing protein n=1 Tax=Vitrella brassicaformis (strain CCMP3155) TaxID=1169540 RepID=A0A0G4G0A6_VITBC|nr:unnamed protein product [Vitrella brassicaformis CCMP3155]|eukprot:CEM21123.1 unnamed protein product [Vitrella brassicaformis CCMP3155]